MSIEKLASRETKLAGYPFTIRDFSVMLKAFEEKLPMKTFRIVLGILAVIPLALLADKIYFRPAVYDEDSLRTLAYLVFGVPILILNLWAWTYPPIIEIYFLGKKDQDN